MAAMWAPPLLLLLQLLAPPAAARAITLDKSAVAASSSAEFPVEGNVYPLGGSSYTYFATQTYQALVAALKAGMSKSLKEVADPALPLCWKGQKPFKSVFELKHFKSLSLSFANNGKEAVLVIPPENYLIVTKHGNACLGILDSSKNKLNELNVVGDVTMQDYMVMYDNETGKIGWLRTSCSKASKALPFLLRSFRAPERICH